MKIKHSIYYNAPALGKSQNKLYVFLLALLTTVFSCSTPKNEDELNRLQYETSAYLLQHANNPIDWYPWGEEALEKAKDEDKLLVISIGYYACHWCQVMEEETFTDTLVARLMNDGFVSMKVDREERPDIDEVYSRAAEEMIGSSGWPLNIIATPNGTPLFAGTYFENEDWRAIIERANYLYQEDPANILSQAQVLAETIKSRQEKVSSKELKSELLIDGIKQLIDTKNGGIMGIQKFPNSPFLDYMLDLTYYQEDSALDSFLVKTLDNMALGGMFDHLQGGFARYATDNKWKVPHFEKMLYDNAQLISVYAKAARKFNDPFYLSVAERTAANLEQEFKRAAGGYLSSINAVSDNQEGGIYTWSAGEIEAIDSSGELAEFFNISKSGNWENGLNVLFTNTSKENYLNYLESDSFKSLQEVRLKRGKVPSDEKFVAGWNSLVITGYVDLFRASNKAQYLDRAISLGKWILDNQLTKEGLVIRNTSNESDLFLEDQSAFIQALISLYQVTFDQGWAIKANEITEASLKEFGTVDSPLLVQKNNAQLFINSYPSIDRDLPSGNGLMLENLLILSELFYDTRKEWEDRALAMLNEESAGIASSPVFKGNWLSALLHIEHPVYEVAILGKEASAKRVMLDQAFRPDIFFLGGVKEGAIPLLENKLSEGRTMVYVCQNKTCKFPTEDTEKAYQLTLE